MNKNHMQPMILITTLEHLVIDSRYVQNKKKGHEPRCLLSDKECWNVGALGGALDMSEFSE